MSEDSKEFTSIFIVKRHSPEELVSSKSEDFKSIKRPNKSYQTTSDEQRYRFVQKILKKELTIREAAAVFGIRYSTAKTIMKVYKSEGRFEKKKHRLKKGYKKLMAVLDSQSPVPSHTIQSPSYPLIYNHEYTSGLPEGFWAKHLTAHLQ